MNAIGKYKILEQMGVGAAGTTYRASDTFRNCELVVKVLDPAMTGTPELRAVVCRDLGRAAELRHPRIVKVRDLGEVDGMIYVATDLLNGVDLRWHIDRHILSLADKLDLMVQVCGALAFAHSMGMAHGNIKPGNIFVTEKDATILDFGIGKCLASIVEAGGRTGALLPNYFAPEQILGKPFTARSDIFSVGVVLYELLAKYPFAPDPNVIPREIVHTTPEPLRSLDPQIPEALSQLIARAIEKDPEKRLERADEFAAGLDLIAKKLSGPVAIAPEVPAAQVPVTPAEPGVAPVAVAATSEPATAAPVASVPAVIELQLGAAPEVKAAPSPAAVPVVPVTPVVQPQPKVAGPAKAASRRPQWVPYAVAAVLTFCITLLLLSRLSVRASQDKSQAPVAAQTQSAPAVKQAETVAPQPQPPAATPAVTAPATEPAAPPAAESAKATATEEEMLSQAKSLWASGKYTQALEKVNDLLSVNPDNMEGKIWKRKIRAAQEAEAAMK